MSIASTPQPFDSAARHAFIAGVGLITPLGADLDVVWERLSKGDVADVKPLANPETGRVHESFQVPPKLVESLGRNPRLRRSSAISYFAVAAGLAALADAGIVVNAKSASRIAVVYAVSDGGVVYTRKLYEQIVKQGANAASPLLFPETVYNAPASHLAAQLGIDGMSYTLVGDASAGLSALKFAEELLAIHDVDHVLVVAAEELDWILCEAYADWRLTRTPLAEGAAAAVLSRTGRWSIRTHAGVPFQRSSNSGKALEKVMCELLERTSIDFVVSPENGTFVDRAVQECSTHWTGATILRPKRQLGEMLGASGLLQVVLGALAVQKSGCRRALAPVVGFNHQASGAVIERAG